MTIKRLAVYAFFALPFLVSQVLAEDPQGWQPTLDAARKAAGQSNRLVLIYFQADWCKACRAMERDTLSQPAVMQNLQANYAAVKVNADFLPMTAKQYGVTLLPTTVVTTADGQLVDKMTGAVDPQQFVGRLNQVATVARRQNTTSLAQVPSGSAPTSYGGAVVSPAPGMQNTAMVGGAAPTVPAPVGAGSPQGVAAPSNDRYAEYNRSYGNPTVVPPAVPTVDPRVAPIGTSPVGVVGMPPAAPQNGMMAGATPGPAAPMTGGTMAPGALSGVGPAVPMSPPPVDAINPPMGLDGFCPVALAEKKKWVPGDRRWGLVHRGRTYLFSGEAERDRFNADPDAFAPVMSGIDVVLAFDQGQQVPGRRECGVFCGKKVYLFADEASLKKFEQNQAFYANQVLQAMRSTANGGNMYR